VLVVDDQWPVRLLCRVNLEPHGIEVLEAGDGVAGLETAAAERPDAILLDVMMPRLDGFGVAERLLADPELADIPIVFLSARADFESQAHGIEIGGVAYLTKPFDPTRLVPILNELLDRLGDRGTVGVRTEKLNELRSRLGEESLQ
jgi:DNA-binding response OmpR family regulator